MANTFEYVRSDYSAARDAAIQRLRARYPGVWNDFSSSNFGTMLIDLIAWSMSNMAYTANRLAGENFVSTMTLRESAVRLGNLTGYKLRSAAPAAVPCAAILASPATADIRLPRGTPVRTGDSLALTFELADDYVIQAGQAYPETAVATIDPLGTGSRTVQSYISLTAGGVYADLLDTTVDLRQYVEVGQLFVQDGQSYEIASIETPPDAESYSRLVLAEPWAGATGSQYTGAVVDRRVTFVQGQSYTDQVQAPAGDTAGFVVRLANQPVIDSSVAVTVNGASWTETQFLVNEDNDAQVFQVRTLPTGVTVLLFGDDRFGQSVPAEAIVEASYRTGGGQVGNIPAGAINTTVTGLITSLSNPVTVSIYNAQPGSGGLDAETLDEARLAIPAHTRTNDRAVTSSDYQTLATGFVSAAGQVRYARAVPRTENALLEGNIVVVYVWSLSADSLLVPASASLKAQLQEYLQTKAVGTDYVVVADGDQQPLPLAVMFKAASGYSVDDLESRVVEAAGRYTASLAPGEDAVYSRLFSAVNDVTGVDQAVFATPTRDVRPGSAISVFSAPPAEANHAVVLTSNADGSFTGQVPMSPLAAWAFTASLAGKPLTVVPDVTPGYARLLGDALDPDQVSTVNLATGLVVLYSLEPATDFIITLRTAQGFSLLRQVDLYAGYTGDLSQAKRREVRNAIRAWADGLAVGETLFGAEITGVRSSAVNMASVVEAVAGVVAVTYTSIGAPQNGSPRLDVLETERVAVRNIYLNSSAD